jgi:hypothetical protein
VVAPVARGESEVIRVDRTKKEFLVSFGVDLSKPEAVVCEFRTESGAKIITLTSAQQATASFNLPILLPTAKFPPGRYQMVLHPVTNSRESTTYPFVIEEAR